MKRSLRRAVSLLCVLAMCLSLLPTTALAGEDGETSSATQSVTATSNGVTVNKYLSGSGTTEDPYKLTLEAYASNTITTSSKPLDIVLVLDVSGSMEEELSGGGYTRVDKNAVTSDGTYYIYSWWWEEYIKLSHDDNGWYYGSEWNKKYVSPEETWFYVYQDEVTKWDALTTAVNNFLTSVKEQNAAIADTDQQHKVALVKFAGEKTDTVGNDTYRDGGWTYNHSQLVCDLTTNISDIEAKFSEIDPAGATSADYGLELAANALRYANAREDAQQVVIFFTDGEPNHSNNFDGAVASDAVNEAHALKEDGVTIYTVGVFEGANPNDTQSNTNKYMNAVSSNYPDARVTQKNYAGQEVPDDNWYGNGRFKWGTRAEDGNYYFTADNAEGLDGVFQDF